MVGNRSGSKQDTPKAKYGMSGMSIVEKNKL